MKDFVLEVKNLDIEFKVGDTVSKPINHLSFSIKKGEALGIVGESGSGKSILTKAIIGNIPPPGRIVSGEIKFNSEDLLRLSEDDLGAIRREQLISIIPENPGSALDPLYTVGSQMCEVIRSRKSISYEVALQKSIDLLRSLRIADPERIVKSYPFQLSGGMQQRVLIAMALSGTPSLIIADDATKSLDVTISAQIMRIIKEKKSSLKVSLLWISSDLAMCSILAEEILVIYKGQFVELALKNDLLQKPKHPYTKVLINALPSLKGPRLERLLTVGSISSNREKYKGCPFIQICNKKTEICYKRKPDVNPVSNSHFCACHHYDK